MKRIFLISALCIAVFNARAQQPATSPYTFTAVKENTVGATENQCQTGTCWSFATVSFLEAEVIRKGGKPVDLSEMYNVRLTYPRKADSYVRFQGKQQFGPGGLSHDVINILRDYGVVPESVYSGLKNGTTEYNHNGLDAMLESTVKTVLERKLNEEGEDWKRSIEGILDAEIGTLPPTNFDFNGKQYTPASFRDALKLNPEDYVSITSFSHHPYYREFVLEVPDNWAKGSFYNVTIDDLGRIADHALDNGYTIAWDADVSEKGFSFTQGVAVMPAEQPKKEEWWTKVHSEVVPTQAARQEAFDRFETTDDHLMHITGKSKDQNGNTYYITKNSWGTTNPFGGYQHVSRNYYLMKTVGIVVHKDALPMDVKTKLGIK
jgi:bleomycin hydrolase